LAGEVSSNFFPRFTFFLVCSKIGFLGFDLGLVLIDQVEKKTFFYSRQWHSFRSIFSISIQRNFFLKLFKLSYRTPGYFIRLETGRIHLKAVVLRHSLKFLARLLSKPANSLLADCLAELRKIDKTDVRYNWLASLNAELKLIDCSHILDSDDKFTLLNKLPATIDKYRILLVNNDVASMFNSEYHPHYCQIKKHVWRESYLKLGTNLASLAMQLRLHDKCLYLNSTFYNLDDICRYCGAPDSISHIIQDCSGLRVARSKHLSTYNDVNFVFNYPDDERKCTYKILSITHFLKNVFKTRQINP
jgi:hypothetical protein